MPFKLKVYHSPDSDDAFMFYGISEGLLKDPSLEVSCELMDIQSLNEKALKGEIDCTAISFHAYAHCFRDYHILAQGASFGDGYGPRLIASTPVRLEDLKGRKVAMPGALTTATLAFRMLGIDCEEIMVPFDRIMDEVREGRADAGLLIHEGQLTYAADGFHLVLDLGEWWKERTGLPLPLGGNVIKKNLDPCVLKGFPLLFRRSIEYSLDNREKALAYAKQFGRGLTWEDADRFVDMYVNKWTRGYGETGKLAVGRFLDEAFGMGLIPEKAEPSFLD
ncbi:MAG TPA: ABC transporter substrate-binding protein [Acidobacteriota bacterium]|nr:ABC transporter substrate-binding protein [Acidobacteriota bacterium]HNT16519.1 ABC transporter substrate-binding protein [Acidobacteriota bacterium]HPA26031.1 ABC transporter substrate-binding protein [Acidobacteriota bacterium]HQO18994.1 ABC transporter substrate-binding protein [Acidobacteriota bacterium]HQQ45887.1 ABC transporter substrate-binding protein [Acidobacteriota bacterium]